MNIRILHKRIELYEIYFLQDLYNVLVVKQITIRVNFYDWLLHSIFRTTVIGLFKNTFQNNFIQTRTIVTRPKKYYFEFSTSDRIELSVSIMSSAFCAVLVEHFCALRGKTDDCAKSLITSIFFRAHPLLNAIIYNFNCCIH